MSARDQSDRDWPAHRSRGAGALDIEIDDARIPADGWQAVDLAALGGGLYGAGRTMPQTGVAGLQAGNDNRRAASQTAPGTASATPAGEEAQRRRHVYRRQAPLVVPEGAQDGEVFVGRPANPDEAFTDHPAYEPLRVQPMPVPHPLAWAALRAERRRRKRLDRDAVNAIVALMVMAWVGIVGFVLYKGNEPSSGAKIQWRKD